MSTLEAAGLRPVADFRPNGLVRSGGPRRHRLRCRPWRRPGSARSRIPPEWPDAKRRARGEAPRTTSPSGWTTLRTVASDGVW